ncbi:MAG: indolepyruvate oxidoreductase subunit beta [Deltaproteobacteria bacterium]|nr:indolepyruvate oxidoreductase subunit beta [Deltaproteobacteria bacterium]
MKRKKTDILLAGVGGQGIISIAAVIAYAALKKGLHIKQSEVHGMSQRGGAVQSHLRISDDIIYSDLLSEGNTDLLLSVEPLEAVRYLPYLSSTGRIVTAVNPFVNIDDYPPMEIIEQQLAMRGRCVFVDAAALAKQAGNPKTTNMVMLGAASFFTGIEAELFKDAIHEIFAERGQQTIDMNINAFQLGNEFAAASGRL